MSDEEIWYYGSVYTRCPGEAVVLKRTRFFLTLKRGVRVKIDGDVFVYRPSKAKWFEWLRGTMQRRLTAANREVERAESDLAEAQGLLDRELELERNGGSK